MVYYSMAVFGENRSKYLEDIGISERGEVICGLRETLNHLLDLSLIFAHRVIVEITYSYGYKSGHVIYDEQGLKLYESVIEEYSRGI